MSEEIKNIHIDRPSPALKLFIEFILREGIMNGEIKSNLTPALLADLAIMKRPCRVTIDLGKLNRELFR